MVVVRESQTRDPGWSIDQELKAVISGEHRSHGDTVTKL